MDLDVIFVLGVHFYMPVGVVIRLWWAEHTLRCTGKRVMTGSSLASEERKNDKQRGFVIDFLQLY